MIGPAVRNAFLSGAAAAGVLLATNAAAASVDADGQTTGAGAASQAKEGGADSGGDDIVVTARRREERGQDVPISLIAVNGAALEAANVRTVADLGQVASGIRLEVTNNRRSTLQVSIRGQRQFGNIPGQDPPTAVYFADAIVFPMVGFNTSLHDIANVQVLKGPQGTLFGRNTTGGALLVTPARPTNDYSAAVTATIGNYQTYGVKGFLNVPVSDSLQMRLAGYYQENDDYQTILTPSLPGRGAGGGKTGDVRLSLLWKPSDNIENYLVAYYATEKNNGLLVRAVALNPLSQFLAPFGNPAAGPVFGSFPKAESELWRPGDDPNKVYGDFPVPEDIKQYNVVDTLTVDLGGVSVKNILAYRRVSGTALINVTGLDLPVVDANQQSVYKTLSQELQLNGSAFDDRLTWTAGAYFFQLKSIDRQYSSFLNLAKSGAAVMPLAGQIKNTSYAGYVQGSYKLTDALILTAGFRYTIDKRKILWRSRTENVSFYYDRKGIPFVQLCNMFDDAGVRLSYDQCLINSNETFKEPTWNLSLDYRVSPSLLLYFTQRRGYRSGGYNLRAQTAAQRVPYKPETVTDFELGFKSDFALAGWNFRLNVAGYLDKYKDLQRSASILQNGVAVSSLFNAASGDVKGLEAEFSVSPVQDMSISANYAYTKFDYKKFDYFANGATRDFSDRDLAGVPRHSLTVAVSYDIPLGDDVGRLALSTNISHQSSYFYSEVYQSKEQVSILYTPAQAALLPDTTAAYKAPGYTLTNLRAEWKDILGGPFDAAFYMKNVFDVQAIVNGSPIYESVGTLGANFAPPRMFGVELRARFN
jgi:iron complex outermembrane receptor protein